MEGLRGKPEGEEMSHLEKLKNIVETEKSNIILIFHRHLEHDTKDGEIDELHRLTNNDLSYVKDISSLFKNTDLSVGFTVDNLRSYLTSYFLLGKDEFIDLEKKDQLDTYKISKESKKIRALKELTYRDPVNTKFGEGLEQAIKDGRLLEFLVSESDNFDLESENISGYSLISSEIARIVYKYFQMRGGWQEISDSKYQSENLMRAFCIREFIYACFRVKLMDKILGRNERDKFVENFSKNHDIKYIGIITFRGEDEIVLYDNFGELSFKVDLLLEVIGENPLNATDFKI